MNMFKTKYRIVREVSNDGSIIYCVYKKPFGGMWEYKTLSQTLEGAQKRLETIKNKDKPVVIYEGY